MGIILTTITLKGVQMTSIFLAVVAAVLTLTAITSVEAAPGAAAAVGAMQVQHQAAVPRQVRSLADAQKRIESRSALLLLVKAMQLCFRTCKAAGFSADTTCTLMSNTLPCIVIFSPT